MNYLLDIVGSFAIAGLLIISVLAFTFIMNDGSNKKLLSSETQSNATETMEIFKFDFNKIGFGATSDKILTATSNQIKFLTNLDNLGSLDTIEYYVGSTSELTNTQNPNDFKVYRKLNGVPKMAAIVTSFVLTFYDSLSGVISYSNLASQAFRNKIKSIGLDVTFQSGYKVDQSYELTNFKTIIRPKNLSY